MSKHRVTHRDGIDYPQIEEPETVIETPIETVSETEIVEPVVEAEAKVEEPAKVEPVVEAAKVEEPVKEEEKIDDGLMLLPETEAESSTTNIADTSISEIFGTEIKSKDEAKAYIEKIQKERDDYKSTSEQTFANDQVKRLNDYFKQGGTNGRELLDSQWKQTELTNQINHYSNVEAIEWVRADLKNEGFTPEQVEEYILKKDELDIIREGNRIKKESLNILQSDLNTSKQQEADLLKDAETKSARFDERIQSHINDLKDVDGFQVNDSDKKNLSKALQNSSSYIRSKFPLDKDGLPTKAFVEAVVKLENYERLKAAYKRNLSNVKSDAKKEAFIEQHNIPIKQADAVIVEDKPVEKGKLLLDAVKKANSMKKQYN